MGKAFSICATVSAHFVQNCEWPHGIKETPLQYVVKYTSDNQMQRPMTVVLAEAHGVESTTACFIFMPVIVTVTGIVQLQHYVKCLSIAASTVADCPQKLV